MRRGINRGSDMIVARLRQERRGNLELVYHRPVIRTGIHGFRRTGVVVLERVGRLVPQFALIIYDQDSRNASIRVDLARESPDPPPGNGGPGCGEQATTGDTGMTATTPSKAELLEGYDRSGWRGEEQIGSGMPLSIPEVRATRHERRTWRWCGGIS